MGQRVLITGVSCHLAGRLAQRLERDPAVEHVVGVDLDDPELDLEHTEFIRADLRNQLFARVLRAIEVDTVVDLSIIATPTRVGGRRARKEIDVAGSLRLFAACRKAPKVRKVVVKSTTAVYGSSPRDPAMFTEDMVARGHPTGFARDSVEVERTARDFGRRRPDVAVTILRFANFMGSGIETSLTRYLSLPAVPTPVGFDPRIQFIHEDDALEVLYRSVREERPGLLNVAGDGVLLLSQAVRICGKLPLPVPLALAAPVATGLRRLGFLDFPADQVQLLVFGRVADNSRLKRVFGYVPRMTTRESLDEFVAGHRSRRFLTPERADRWGRALLALLARASTGAGPSWPR